MPMRLARVMALCLNIHLVEFAICTTTFAQLVAQVALTSAQIEEAIAAAARGNPRALDALVANHFGSSAAFDQIRIAVSAAMSKATPVELSNISKAIVGTGNAGAISSAMQWLAPAAQAAVARALVESGDSKLILAVAAQLSEANRATVVALLEASGASALATAVQALPPAPPSAFQPSPQQLQQGSPN